MPRLRDWSATLRLVVVSPGDAEFSFAAALALPECVFAGGATTFWIRERGLDDARLRELADAARVAADRHGGAVWISGRADVAVRARLDAVQLGHRDVRPETLAAERKYGLAIGFSAHDPLDVAAIAACDHVALAPLFPTVNSIGGASRKAPPLGVLRFAELVRDVPCPTVALGGIDAENAEAAIGAGAAGVAVLRAVCRAADPEAAARALRRVVDRALG